MLCSGSYAGSTLDLQGLLDDPHKSLLLGWLRGSSLCLDDRGIIMGEKGHHTEGLSATLQSALRPQLDTRTRESVAQLAGCSVVAPVWIPCASFLTKPCLVELTTRDK